MIDVATFRSCGKTLRSGVISSVRGHREDWRRSFPRTSLSSIVQNLIVLE
jgi:hypothetical protein